MADRFYVGGTATWNSTAGTKWATTTGGVGGAAAPTAADDVYFDVLSVSAICTLSASSVARSINCNTFVGQIIHPASTSISIGDGTAGAGNVALRLVAGMTYTLGDSATSAITFVSTSATQQTIATGTKTLGNWTISNAGSSYLLSDGNTASTVTLTNGILNTNGQTCAWAAFNSNNSNTRTLTLGASAINVSSASSWVVPAITNLTVTANTAVLTQTASSASFNSGSINWNGLSVVQTGAASPSINGGAVTLANYTRTGTALKTDGLSVAGDYTITTLLTLNGNSTVNRLNVFSSAVGTTRTLTAAAVSISNADFMDITGAGAAAPFTGTSLGDALGNSGITFDAPTTQTHDGTTSNWSTAARWTSRVPLPQDTVLIPSGVGVITGDMPRLGVSVNCTGFTGTLNLTSTGNTVYGAFTIATGMTYSQNQTFTLAARSSTTITSALKTFGAITLNAPGGTYTQQDAMTATGAFQPLNGTWTTNNLALSILRVTNTSTSATLNFGTSTVTFTESSGVTVFSGTNGTINASTANFVISNASSGTRTFVGGGRIFGSLTYTVAGSTGQLTITGANTFGTFNFSDGSNARTLALTAGTITTISNLLNINGTVGNLMSIVSTVGASAATLALTNAADGEYLSIQDITKTGGSFYAGTRSTNVSGNTGIYFSSRQVGRLLMMGCG